MTFPETYDELAKWRDGLRRAQSGPDLIHALEVAIEREFDPDRWRILNAFLAQEHIAHGNQAAADATRYNDPIEEVRRWHDEWRAANPEADFLPVLQERLRNESHPMKLRELRFWTAEEYRNRGDYAASTGFYRDVFSDDPSEPMPLIILSGQKFQDEQQPEEAMRIINEAIEVAIREGTYRRLALGMKARISLHLKDYPAVEDVLRQIIDLKFGRGNVDIGRERDFFDGLPPGSIDPAVARQYDEYCRARGKPAEPKD